jgi:sigma-B regulation protein RsbU (phosphoserine phosphatase)
VNSSIPIEVLRADALGVLLGGLILMAGTMGIFLFLIRPRPRDSAVLGFGIAASMYGLRLIATTRLVRDAFGFNAVWDWIIWVVNFTIFIPFTVFFVNTVAPQWKKASNWIMGIAGAEALFGIIAYALGVGAAASKAYSVEVLLYLPLLALMLFLPRRPADRELWVIRAGFLIAISFAIYTNLVALRLLPGRADLEPLGFLVFLCCQGYVAAERTFRNEQRLAAINKELEIARSIQSGLLPGRELTVSGLEVAAKYVPASSVAGDFYDFLIADDRGLGILIADVSGHGVPAALSASMVKVAMHAQSERVAEPAEVLAGLNSILCGNLQGQFVTAAYVFIDVARRQISYSGAGHPPLLLWRASEGEVRSIEENGLILGAFAGCDYKTFTCNFEARDRCLLYTDGVIEAPNGAGEEFGSERLRDLLGSRASSSAAALCDEVARQITSWCGRKETSEAHDDMTIVVIDFKGSASNAEDGGKRRMAEFA